MTAVFLADIIRGAESAFANMASALQEERDPQLPARLGGHAEIANWREDTRIRLRHLSVALRFETPNIFSRFIAWQRAAFAARQIGSGLLTQNLDCLREIIADRAPAEIAASAEPYFTAARKVLEAEPKAPACQLPDDPDRRALAEAYIDAALNGDREQATRLIRAAIDNNALTLREAYADLLAPVQRELGRLWQLGRLGVQDEHLASYATVTTIARLHEHIADTPRDGRVALATSVEGDTHDLGLRMASDFLELDGWRVAMLGADTPPADVLAAIDRFDPALVLASAAIALHLPAAQELVRAIRAEHPDRPPYVLVGGGAFDAAPELWQKVGADAGVADLTGVAKAAAILVPAPVA